MGDRQRRYLEKYPERVRAQKRESARRRYWEDETVRRRVIDRAAAQYRKKLTTVEGRIVHNLRGRLYQALKHSYKSGSAVRDLGCSIAEFKLYIENQFEAGMTWENYGEWEYDHVQPLASFDLTDRQQFLEACNWLNIRPMWAGENRSRGRK